MSAVHDGSVMARQRDTSRLAGMGPVDVAAADPIRVLVLEEFRLRVADEEGAAAQIVAASTRGIEPAIPLLTSIDDRRDVATLRALHAGESTESDAAQHAALDPLVSSWAAPKHYGPRMTERSQHPPSSFRLAVTESGINTGVASPVKLSRESATEGTSNRPVGLVWIGAPVGTHAGLLILLGSYDDPRAVAHAASEWPLPLSRDLGVRIYESGGVTPEDSSPAPMTKATRPV